MVRSATITVTAEGKPPVTELESGRYRYTYHGSKSEFRDVEEIKRQIKQRWELEEGVTVESVEVKQVKAPETLPEEYVWYEGTYATITEDHTDLIMTFRVESPLAIAIIVILVAFLIGVIVGFLLAGGFAKLVEVVEKFPEIIPLGLVLVAVVLLVGVAGVRVPKRKKEGEV